MTNAAEDAARVASAAAERAARLAYGKLVARIARHSRDIAAAEDALSGAFAKALASWPVTGVPDAPEAWLTTAARRELIDGARRCATRDGAAATLAILADERADAPAGDARLGLILAASHPAIAAPVHAPLILQTVFGITAVAMAPAFLLPAATIGQRLSRAKAKIKAARIPFDTAPADRRARLARALDALYALHAVADGGAAQDARPLKVDALELSLLVAELAPDTAEALGLAALLTFTAARDGARRDAKGAYVPLSQQDPARWNATLIARAEAMLHRAASLGDPGPYQTEAAIQSVHCDRRRTGRCDWDAVAALYDALWQMAPNVGAGVARAAAHAKAHGPAAGRAALDALPQESARAYQPYWAVRAHLSPRTDGAREAYDNAIALTQDAAVRAHLEALRASAGHALGEGGVPLPC